MATLPGIPGEVYFGFSRELPNWRGSERQSDPAALSQILGFNTADLDIPADSPAILVRRARKHSGPRDLAPAFETAAALPDYLPSELHEDAWKQAHRIAAGAAMEQPEQAESLQSLARGALRFARKFARGKKAGVPQGTPDPIIETEPPPKPKPVLIRRWKDAKGYVHSPNAPKPTCVEQSPGPRGGRIWDCSGGGKDKEKPDKDKPLPVQPKPTESQKTSPKQSLSLEQASNLIQKTRNNPTTERVAALSAMLVRLPKEELRQLKRTLGVRADDNTKAGLAAKIAKAATVRLTQREHWMQEARRSGVRPEDMLLASRDIRETHNRLTDTVNKIISEARESYQKQFGKLITRRMKAFNGGDYNQIPGFDVLAREMAGQYPEILGNEGYEGDQGTESAQKLFSLFAAGKQGRMSFGESQREAIGLLKSGEPMAAKEATPFAKRGEAVHA